MFYVKVFNDINRCIVSFCMSIGYIIKIYNQKVLENMLNGIIEY